MLKKLWQKYKKYIPSYLVAIAIPLLVGIIAAYLTREDMSIYNEITKPPLAPPSLLFPIAWTLLYILMGISSAIVYNLIDSKNREIAREGLTYYLISLAFNFIWPILFFKLRVFAIAVVCLAILLFFIAKTILCYRKISPLAAYLQIPYAIWVLFAGYLNVAIAILN
jgi:tryptophan-rich sensory protein